MPTHPLWGGIVKNSRLAHLALGDGLDQDALIVEALVERLSGERGEACTRLAERMAARPQPSSSPAGAAWCTFGARAPTSASRRDGVSVHVGDHPRLVSPCDGAPRWYATFPPLPGGIEPVAELPTAESIVDAMDEVDHRWPMPAWWRTLDDRSGVVDACSATQGGRRCTRAPGHTGAHVAMGHGELLATWEAP